MYYFDLLNILLYFKIHTYKMRRYVIIDKIMIIVSVIGLSVYEISFVNLK